MYKHGWLLLGAFFLLLLPFFSFAQVGPMGIGNKDGTSTIAGSQPRLLLWLDGSSAYPQPSGVATSAQVDSMIDKSGNGHTFVQNGTYKPILYISGDGPSDPSGPKGTFTGAPSTPAVAFLNRDDQLLCQNFTLPGNGYTIYFVIRTNDNNYGLFSYADLPNASEREMLIYNDSDNGGIHQQMDNLTPRLSQIGDLSTNTWNYGGIFWNNATDDNWEFSQGAAHEGGFNTHEGVTFSNTGSAMIGNIQNTAGDYSVGSPGEFEGAIAEIFIYDGRLNRPAARLLSTYLWVKYGLKGKDGDWDMFHGNMEGTGNQWGGKYYAPVGIGNETGGANGGSVNEARSSGLVLRPYGSWTTTSYLCAAPVGSSPTVLTPNSAINDDVVAPVLQRWSRQWEISGNNQGLSQEYQIAFDFGEGIGGSIPQNPENFVLLYRDNPESGDFSVLDVPNENKSVIDDELVFRIPKSDLVTFGRYYTIGTTDPTSSLTGSIKRTWYAYESGNWNDSGTWTLDGNAAAAYVNPEGAYPAVDDNVYIGSGKSVTLNINTNGTVHDKLTVLGTLDLASSAQPTFTTISGSGLIRCSSNNFPAGNSAAFADPINGGTLEFYGANDITQTVDLVVNKLKVNLSTSAKKLTLAANLTTNGLFEVNRGTFIVNDNASISRTLISNGPVLVESLGRIFVSTSSGLTTHKWYFHDDLINIGGQVKFTNRISVPAQSAAAYTYYTTPENQDIITAYFSSGSKNQKLRADGLSYFSRIVIDKGIDMTYTLSISSNNQNYFKLLGHCETQMGPDNYVEESENPNSFALINGTAEIKSNIFIPLLVQINNYTINHTAHLWVNGGEVTKGPLGAATDVAGHSLVIYGKITVSSGKLNSFNCGGILVRDAGLLQVDGGIVNANAFQTSDLGTQSINNLGGLSMNGGTMNLNGNFSGNIRSGFHTLSLTYPGNLFLMTGGTLNITGPSNTGLVFINSDPQNTNVSGGTVHLKVSDTKNTYNIASRAAFWDLTLTRSIATSTTGNFKVIGGTSGSSGANSTLPVLDLIVRNNLSISGPNNPKLTMGDASTPSNLYLYGDLTISAGAVYEHNNNTTHFVGSSESILKFGGTAAYPFFNVVVNKDLDSRYIEINGTETTVAMDILGSLYLEKGYFNNSTRWIDVKGNIINRTQLGVDNLSGWIRMSGSSGRQEIISEGGIFYNLRINNPDGVELKNGGVTIKNRLHFDNGSFFIGDNKLRLESTYSAPITGYSSPNNLVVCSGTASAGGLEMMNHSGSQVMTYPIGVISGSGNIKYTWAQIHINTPPDVVPDPPNIIATGGEESAFAQNGSYYKMHVFQDDGTLTVTQPANMEYLIVAGGGGGGAAGSINAGGGGGGGVVGGSIPVTAGAYPITVGDGGIGGSGGNSGANSPRIGTNGSNSTALGFTALGGGGGAGAATGSPSRDGNDGGSGGGGSIQNGGLPGQAQQPGINPTATIDAGTDGGTRSGNGSGGGGAGGNTNNGFGGPGLPSTITGTEVHYGGGGSGISAPSGTAPVGSTLVGEPGTANSGAGGGAGSSSQGYDGGSGIVIVRYEITEADYNAFVGIGEPSDGFIRIAPVDTLLFTADLDGSPDYLNFYWKVSSTGFETKPNVTHVFRYVQEDVIGNEALFESGRVLSEFTFDRSVDNVPVSGVNKTTNTIYYNGPLEAQVTTGDGIELVNADYSAGNADRFIGRPEVYFSRSSTVGAFWETTSNWSTCDGCTDPHVYHGTSAPAIEAEDYPKVGDIAVIGFNVNSLKPHVYTAPSGGIEAAQILFTPLQDSGGNRQPRYNSVVPEELGVLRPTLQIANTSDIIRVAQISGEGALWLQNDIDLGVTDIGGFLSEDSSIVVIRGVGSITTSAAEMTMNFLPNDIPNLFIAHAEPTITSNSHIRGNLEIAGKSKLYLSETPGGNFEIIGDLIVKGASPALLFNRGGNLKTINVHGDVKLLGTTAHIGINPDSSSPDTLVAWTPSEIDALLWLDATKGVTASGGHVSEWQDQVSGTYIATQNIAGKNPTYQVGINGLNTIRFDGDDDFLAIPSSNELNIEPNEDFEIFTVAQVNNPNNPAAQSAMIFAKGVNNNYDFMLYAINNKYSIAMDNGGMIINAPATLGTGANLGWARRQGSTGYLYNTSGGFGTKNGVANVSNSGNPHSVTLGAAEDGEVRFLNGDIGEIILIKRALTSDERQKVEGYLAHKWGLTAKLPDGHPYKNNVPFIGESNAMSAQLIVSGNIIQNFTSTATVDNGLELYKTIPAVPPFVDGIATVNLVVTGSSNNEYKNLNNGLAPKLWKLTIDKGSNISSSFTFNTKVAIDAFANESEKPVNINNGLLIFNHPEIDITLSSGGEDFVIPKTGGLQLDTGKLKIVGQETGLLLSGLLKITGGSLNLGDTEGDNNYIQYGGGGAPKLYIQGGKLTVGSQIRRTIETPLGALDYRQTGGDVIIGRYSAPATTRGMLEVLNPESNFDFTDGSITFVRGLNSSSAPSLLLQPDTYNTIPASDFIDVVALPEIIIGNADTPPGVAQNFGIQSQIPLYALTIDSTNSPSVHLMSNDLELLGKLTIDTLATLFWDNDRHLKLHNDVTNNGTLSSPVGKVWLIHPDSSTISGSGIFDLFDLERIGSSGYTNVQSDILVNRDFYNDEGEMDFEAKHTLTVKRHVTMDGILGFGDISNGLIFSGTETQNLTRRSTGVSKLDIVTINNSSGLTIPQGISTYVIGKKLRLERGVFSLTGNLLEMASGSVFTDVNQFSENNMIKTGGAYTDYGVKVNVPANFSDDIYVPLGIDRYTPINMDFSSSGSTASAYSLSVNVPQVGVIIEDEESPNYEIVDSLNVLKMYFSVDGTDIGDGLDVNLKFHYAQQYFRILNPPDTTYSEADYIAARALPNSTAISKLSSAEVDEENNIITFNIFGNYSGDEFAVDGDYFAGIDDAIPTEILEYKTRNSVLVNNGLTGYNDESDDPTTVPGGGAPRGARVTVQSGHTLTFNINGVNFYQTIIEEGAKILINGTSQHRLGRVTGTGTIHLVGSGNLPAGNYTNFFGCDGGKLIFQNDSALSYEVLSNMPTVEEVTFQGSGNGEMTIADNAVNICGNLIIEQLGKVKAANTALLTVEGNLEVKGGGDFDLRQGNTLVKGDLIISGPPSPISGGSITSGNNGLVTVEGNVIIGGRGLGLGTVFRETHVEGNVSKTTNPTAGSIQQGTDGAKLVFDGIAPQTIKGDFTLTSKIPSIEINNGAGLYLGDGITNGNVDISESLILTNGNIFTNSTNILKLTEDETVVEPLGGHSNSFVNGPMQWFLSNTSSKRIFPVGKNDRFRPLFLDERSADRTWEVEYYDEIALIQSPLVTSMDPYPDTNPEPIASVSKQEHWRVNSNSASGTNAKVGLSWGDSSAVDPDPNIQSNLLVLAYGYPHPNVWNSFGGQDFSYDDLTNTGNLVSSLPVHFTQRFLTLGSTDALNPLPVTWLYFTGENKEEDNVLSWATATEKNNDYFELERSLDANNWTVIAQITAAGYSTTEQSYSYTDTQAPFGRVYYRLKQVDFDGENDFAPNVVSLERGFSKDAEVFDFLLYPNPTRIGTVQFRMSNISDVRANVSIYDLSGQLLSQEYVQIDGMGTSASVSCNLEPGIYLVTVIVNDKLRSKPLVVTR